jgi:hypothetical protein
MFWSYLLYKLNHVLLLSESTADTLNLQAFDCKILARPLPFICDIKRIINPALKRAKRLKCP